jgi:hypothetical protein
MTPPTVEDGDLRGLPSFRKRRRSKPLLVLCRERRVARPRPTRRGRHHLVHPLQQGLVELIRPSRIKTDEYTDEGVPVWLPADVRSPWELEEAPRFADPERVDPRTITEPGDVVFTTIGGLRTRVDFEGGHVLGTSLHALRLQREIFDPEAVAALLTSEPNRRLIKGSTIPRVNMLELELPLLDRAAAAELVAAIRELHHQEAAGHRLGRTAATTREALVAAVSAGTLRVRSTRGESG